MSRRLVTKLAVVLALAGRLAADAGAGAQTPEPATRDLVAAEKTVHQVDQPGAAVQVAERMNQLGSKAIAHLLAKRDDANVVVSPYGLGTALHLLLLGAGSGSAAERSLEKSLLPAGLSAGRQDEAVASLRQRVLAAGSDRLRLTVASAVFLPQPAEHSERFQQRALRVLAAPIEALDFNSASALERVNAWARESTSGLVPRLVDALDPDARFVLANAVHFSGAWEAAFNPARTATAPFTRADGSKRDVPMMDTTQPADLAELGGLQALWLPYAGGEIAMLIVASAAQEPVGAVAEALRSRSLDSLGAAAQRQLRRGPVHIRLPRFRADSVLDLSNALESQIKPALAPASNYDPISRGKSGPLQVVHRAVLEVTEAGTRAAAATAITSDRSLAIPPLFSADRPFAFAVVHRTTGAILFAGYVADPGDAPRPVD